MIITNLEDIKKYQGVIVPELYGHPQFMRELDYALKWYKEECGPVFLNLEVFDDGKKIIISHQFVSNRVNPNMNLNNELLSFNFSVNEYGGLSVETSSGVCYDKDQFVSAISKDFVNGASVDNSEKKSKMERVYADYASILATYFQHKYYNAVGVQLTDTYYSDLYPLNDHKYNDDLKEQVLTDLHKPKSWSFNIGPELPVCVSNAKYIHSYRYENELGLVHKIERLGIHVLGSGHKFDEGKDVWEVLHGEHPEYLTTVSGLSIAEQKKDVAKQFEYVGVREFAGLSEHEIRAKVAEIFATMVDNSKTRELNPRMYEILKNYAEETNKKYNIASVSTTELGR